MASRLMNESPKFQILENILSIFHNLTFHLLVSREYLLDKLTTGE